VPWTYSRTGSGFEHAATNRGSPHQGLAAGSNFGALKRRLVTPGLMRLTFRTLRQRPFVVEGRTMIVRIEPAATA